MSNCYNIQIFSLSIILICLFAPSEASIDFRKLESTSRIALKVNEIGMQFILNESFRPLPNKILVAGKEIDKIDSQINITETNSLIELFWNEPVTDCHAMFAEMSNISEIDFTDFDTSKVTNMSNMFMNCESLKELDLSSFDTSNVLDMSKMFSKCNDLQNLKISNFKTEKVTNMERMFEYCLNLETLDIHNFNTLSVTNMGYMFYSCLNLKSLDLSNFKTSAAESMMAMFANCLSLESLNLTYVDFSNTINSAFMLFDTSIMILDLSKFNGESIILNDDILKFNPNLKYIRLQNYKGKDIFNDLDSDSEIIICADNDTMKLQSNLLSLKEKNVTNNCSNYCFSEFRKINEETRSCEIDCSKIENETNIYDYLCKNKIESSIISDTVNIGETISLSTDTSNIESTIISDSATNKNTILADATNIKEANMSESSNVEEEIISDHITNKQTRLPETPNAEEIISSDTTTMKQTILSDATNVEGTIPSETNKQTIIPGATNVEGSIPSETNKQTIIPGATNVEGSIPSETNKQTIIPGATNVEGSIPSETNTTKQTIIPGATNVEGTIPPETTNIKQTILPDATHIEKAIPSTTNIKLPILPKTTINKPTILPDATHIEKENTGTTNIKLPILPDNKNIEKTIPRTTNIKPAILPNASNTEPTILPQTIIPNTISAIDTKNSISNKYIILLYGYDNYNFQNNLITFSIYFLKSEGISFPKLLLFTINIMFEYIGRNLVEQSNQKLTCSLADEEKLEKYNCESNAVDQMNIMKITVNYDFNFNFNNSYDLVISPFAQFYRDKIVNQTGNIISSKELIIFKGNLTQEDDYFNIKGKLDEDSQLDNHFNLTVLSNDSDLIPIICEETNEKYDNYEIKCEKKKSIELNINNSISFMESKQLLVIIDGEEKVFSKTQNTTKNSKYNRFYLKNNNSLSSGMVISIIIPIVIVCLLAGLMIIFRKKLFSHMSRKEREKSETQVDLKISSYQK